MPPPETSQPERAGEGRGLAAAILSAGPVRALLRVPLFWKILVSNSVLVLAGVVAACLLVGGEAGSPSAETLSMLAAAAVGVTALLNAVTVHLALAPQRALEETARRVQEGDLSARAPVSPLADADVAQLVDVFNHMLDELEASRAQQRRLTRQTMEAEEQIREEVAGMLEDDVAQVLASSLLEARVANGDGEEDGEEAPEPGGLRGSLATALERVRATARTLRPPELRDLGLASALRAYARSAVEAGGRRMELNVDADPVDPKLSEEARLSLYRILQEAIANAVRHSGAGTLSVRVRTGEGRVEAEVVDDGVGFDVAEVDDARGATLGLFGIRERAAHAGGSVEISSRPGEGTRIRVVVPAEGEGSRGRVKAEEERSLRP